MKSSIQSQAQGLEIQADFGYDLAKFEQPLDKSDYIRNRPRKLKKT